MLVEVSEVQGKYYMASNLQNLFGVRTVLFADRKDVELVLDACYAATNNPKKCVLILGKCMVWPIFLSFNSNSNATLNSARKSPACFIVDVSMVCSPSNRGRQQQSKPSKLIEKFIWKCILFLKSEIFILTDFSAGIIKKILRKANE